jgi:deoxyribodipyrimidine photolyase-related protein
MKTVAIIFPHQLFEKSILLQNNIEIYLVEEYLFFNQYKFHQQKIVFHRASMKFYESYLKSNNIKVHYIDAQQDISDIRKLIVHLHHKKISTIEYIDTTDYLLEKRLSHQANKYKIQLKQYTSSLFINTKNDLAQFFKDKKKYFQTDFYIHQRKIRKILIDKEEKPIGGKWTFDGENRLKYPKDKVPPKVVFPGLNNFYKEAIQYVITHYSSNYGTISSTFIYPTTFVEAKDWLKEFFKNRFFQFGDFEDSIVDQENILHHSVLTPMLNVGLLTPEYVLKEAVAYATKHNTPINSLEGFVRQILGWREFIRAVYIHKGTIQRTTNYWKFTRRIPTSFYTGTTGITPIDDVIKKVLATGYAHHIERLMILGNFMLLCEFDPNEVHQWFMELFIDAYDWVMVPNVYGMTQFADGGIMATKPYISGSNYILKMSNYKKTSSNSAVSWEATFDGLFWAFMHKQRTFFLQNPRLGMLVHTFDKMSEEKKNMHLNNATNFLKNLT